jgi:enoyl-CoA hydratase
MTGTTVRTEWRDRVLVVTIDRPERRNAVDHQTLLSLRAAQAVAVEGGARVLVLSGAPPAFCAGADLTGVESGEFTRVLLDVLHEFGRLPFACIAAIDGPALGAGTQLAIACDLRVATASSRFGIPAAKLGLVVDHWTVERLAREAGWSIARNMLLAATTYDAAALAPGFVHRLGGLDAALEWADEIALLAPLTIAGHKIALERSGSLPAHDDLVAAARDQAWASADAEEGRTAFLAKRPPRFTGT